MNTASARPKTPGGVEDSTFRVGSVEELRTDPETVRAFIRASWNRETAMGLEPFYDWQFRASPDSDGADHCLVVADEAGGVHGFMGVNVHTFNLGGRELRGAALTTWIHAEEARGPYAVDLLKTLQRTYDVMLGSGISQDALPVYAQLGFRFIAHLPRYVRVFQLPQVLPFSRIKPFGRRLINRQEAFPRVAHQAQRAKADELLEIVQDMHQRYNCFSRQPEYLRWRYERHPFFRYDIFRVESQAGRGAVILRLDEQPAYRFVHVLDVLGPRKVLPALIGFVEAYCQEIGAAFADFSCASIQVAHLFWSRHWWSVLDDTHTQVPHLFHPIELREPPTTSVTLWCRNDLEELLDLSRLYFTKGDCDLDLPTPIFIRGDH